MNTIDNPAIYVLYHAKCQDGLGAKYAAYKKFADNATYIPVNYGEDVPEMDADSIIYILDFSYPKDILLALRDLHEKVVVIDHHKTAQEQIGDLPDCIFDMNQSGAVLAWKYFHPNTSVPDILKFIEDRDIWKWRYPGTKNVLATLSLAEDRFDEWEQIEANIDLAEKSGGVVGKYQDLCVKRAVTGSGWKKVLMALPDDTKAYPMVVYNATHLVSEIGNELCKQLPDRYGSVGFSMEGDGQVLLSFRSLGNDISFLAKALGGGGHKTASGAKVSLATFLSLFKDEDNYIETTMELDVDEKHDR